MFIIKWWRYFRGFVVISLEGRGVERLLNLAISRGLGFWDLQKLKGGARFSLSLDSFRALRPLVRQTRCRLRIEQKIGLPFLKVRLRRRWGLVAGAVLFIVIVYLATSFVWHIRVVGNRRLEESEILALVERCGVYSGVWKRKIDLDAVADELPRRNSAIAWAVLRLRGILLEIEIVEHLALPERDSRPADLVASRDGLVERIVLIEGRAAVEVGDTVSRGDLLIEGLASLEEGILGPEELPLSKEVRARGKVEARVWYEAREPLKLTAVSKKPTGRSSSVHFLRRGGRRRRLWGQAKNPYRSAREEVRLLKWGWRNLNIPVELESRTYYELEVALKTVPYDQALRRAREKAVRRLEKEIPGKKGWEKLYFEEYNEKEAGWVRAVVEKKEEISMVKLRRP